MAPLSGMAFIPHLSVTRQTCAQLARISIHSTRPLVLKIRQFLYKLDEDTTTRSNRNYPPYSFVFAELKIIYFLL